MAASSADGIGTGDGGPAVPAGLTAEEATEEDAAAIDRIDAVLEDLREFLDIAPLPDGLELADELDKLAAESITIPVTVDSSPEPPPSGPAVGGTDTALGHLGESGEDTDGEAAAADGDRRAEEWSSSSKVSLAESALAAESPPTPAGDPLKAAASKSQAIAGYLTSRSKGSNPFALEMMAMDRQTEVFAPLPLVSIAACIIPPLAATDLPPSPTLCRTAGLDSVSLGALAGAERWRTVAANRRYIPFARRDCLPCPSPHLATHPVRA